jgi:hypothetical protein
MRWPRCSCRPGSGWSPLTVAVTFTVPDDGIRTERTTCDVPPDTTAPAAHVAESPAIEHPPPGAVAERI